MTSPIDYAIDHRSTIFNVYFLSYANRWIPRIRTYSPNRIVSTYGLQPSSDPHLRDTAVAPVAKLYDCPDI